jgi:hypothetical protein
MMLIKGFVLSTMMAATPQSSIHATEAATAPKKDAVAEASSNPNESPEFRKYREAGGKVYQGYPAEIAAETERKCVRDTKIKPWSGGSVRRWMQCLPVLY